ncbi:MAG: hypothetical protein RR758_07735, partial [Burkholderiaceae bacterium]
MEYAVFVPLGVGVGAGVAKGGAVGAKTDMAQGVAQDPTVTIAVLVDQITEGAKTHVVSAALDFADRFPAASRILETQTIVSAPTV